jgi:hypothetical protein
MRRLHPPFYRAEAGKLTPQSGMGVELPNLKELIPLCRENGVRRLKYGRLELEFDFGREKDCPAPTKAELAPGVTAVLAAVPSPEVREQGGQTGLPQALAELVAKAAQNGSQLPPSATGIATEKVPDAVVPQGLEEEMDPDKVLHWSSPDYQEGDVPLTDEKPLVDPAVAAEGRPNG